MRKILVSLPIDTILISFKNGKDAIENFKSCLSENNQLPDIVLLDIEMPFMNGWGFMKQMELLIEKHQISYPKIYIVSSSISYDDIEKSKSFTTILEYYSKPINSDDLNRIIQKN